MIKPKTEHKDKLEKALAVARTLKKRGLKQPSIEKSFSAPIVVGAQERQERTVFKIDRLWARKARLP